MSKVLISDVAIINKKNIELSENLKFINYLDTSSITNNKINGYQKLYINKDKIPSRAKRLVKNNTIVYSSVRPRLCHFGILKDLPENTVVSTGFITIDAKEDIIDPYYLYYILTNKENTEYLSSIADTSVSSYPSINPSDISNMEINIIEDINEQKKIANILKMIDFRIENNNRINEELESMAKTIYDYWFLQFEFPNEEGKAYKSSGGKMVWNDELKRVIPEGWEYGNIGCLFDSQAGYAFKSKDWTISGQPVLTIKAIDAMGNINFKDSCYIDNDFDKKLLKYAVKNGNMVFAMSGNTIGKVGIIASNIDNILINQRVLIIKTKPASIAYPYFILKDSRVRNLIEQLGRNSAQPNISEEQLRNIKTIIPQNLILKKYNEICSFYFEKKIKNQIENQELEQLRDFILPLLMNGQIEFRELELAEG